MPVVDIYARDILIGEAVLKGVDEGMGVASGPFHPSSRYAEIRSQITAAAEMRHQNLPGNTVELQARSKAGELIAVGWVQIDDFEDVEVDPEATIQFADRDQWLRLSRSDV